MNSSFRQYSSFFTLLFCLSVSLLLACGKKGPPLPPEDLSPQKVISVAAEGSVTSVDLKWKAPQTSVSGKALNNLDGFVLRRALVKNSIEGNLIRGKFQSIAKIRYQTETGLSGLSRDFIYRDRDVVAGQMYDYRVSAENKQGYEGKPSEVLRVLFKGRSSEIERLRE